MNNAEPTTIEHVSLKPAWGNIPAASDQGFRRLARAVVIQAVKDAGGVGTISAHEQFGAVDWLAGSDGADYCEFSGVNHRAVIDWLYDGAPYPDNY